MNAHSIYMHTVKQIIKYKEYTWKIQFHLTPSLAPTSLHRVN